MVVVVQMDPPVVGEGVASVRSRYPLPPPRPHPFGVLWEKTKRRSSDGFDPLGGGERKSLWSVPLRLSSRRFCGHAVRVKSPLVLSCSPPFHLFFVPPPVSSMDDAFHVLHH